VVDDGVILGSEFEQHGVRVQGTGCRVQGTGDRRGRFAGPKQKWVSWWKT
jgi:hypothetical protein